MHFERMLDPTARIPGQVYWCCSHHGFSDTFDPENGGHYPRLDEFTLCHNCVRWEDLCDQWITVGSPDYCCASVRCQLAKGHDHGHIVDDLNGQRFSWIEDSPHTEEIYTMESATPVATITHPGGMTIVP